MLLQQSRKTISFILEVILQNNRKNEWYDLFIEPSIDLIGDLSQRMENLRGHDSKTETAISLLQDRYYRVLETLEQCKKYWHNNRGLLDEAFALCVEVLYGLYQNSDPQVEKIINEMEERLSKCYIQFAQSVGGCVSLRCEQILSNV